MRAAVRFFLDHMVAPLQISLGNRRRHVLHFARGDMFLVRRSFRSTYSLDAYFYLPTERAFFYRALFRTVGVLF